MRPTPLPLDPSVERDDTLEMTVATVRGPVIAVLTWPAWQRRFGPCPSDASLREIYVSNRALIDAAVRARAQRSSRKLPILRPGDL